MTSKERVLERERSRGRMAARDLAARAPDLDGTAIIAEEDHIPAWREDAVYTSAMIGWPLRHDDQIYILLQPHTPAHNPGVYPADLPANYSRQNTSDPKKAKDWMAPNGVSGVYIYGNCCRENGRVYRSNYEGSNVWRPSDVAATNPELWEDLGSVEEIQGGES